jgi:hypothetical protein
VGDWCSNGKMKNEKKNERNGSTVRLFETKNLKGGAM